MRIFYVINFLSAFLLFQIELIISKLLLPSFGGSYLVWGACMVFFQCMLLVGYFYSHFVVQSFGMRRYAFFHLIAILSPLLIFPGRPLIDITSHQNIPLVIDVFAQLLVSIGLVFFILSTTSIITQMWVVASKLSDTYNPYVLYAVSNAGSFAALLSYPFIFELLCGLDTQLTIWRVGYALLILLYFFAFRVIPIKEQAQKFRSIIAPALFTKQVELTTVKKWLQWLLPPMAASMMLIAATNTITYTITPCPLLWIIPLCLYLLSFILVFREKPVCPYWIKEKFHLVVGLAIAFFFVQQMNILPKIISLGLLLIVLSAICIACHYNLYLSRPDEKKHLTSFYCIMSLGAALGSIFVVWIVPLVFFFCATELEYLFAIFAAVSSLMLYNKAERKRLSDIRWILYVLLTIYLWPLVFKRYNVFGIAFLFFVFTLSFAKLKSKVRLIWLSTLLILVSLPFVEANWQRKGEIIYVRRNYYGIHTVATYKDFLILRNGTTIHGAQYLNKEMSNQTISYYHPDTAIFRLMKSNAFGFKDIGVMGLGAGVIAAFGKENQEIDFYELDPDTFFIADSLFSYIKNSPARINFIFGDARITLKQNKGKKYDILIFDAFSGDSIPIHLLTTEALMEYKSHLKEGGILLLHVSNFYVDLIPILYSNAKKIDTFILHGLNNDKGFLLFGSEWVALTWDKDTADILVSQISLRNVETHRKWAHLRPWSDKYSCILVALRPARLLEELKRFTPFYW